MELDSHRDLDLAIIGKLYSSLSSQPHLNLVVTGSYSIEALTGTKVAHNDIDTNVFTPRVKEAINTIPDLIKKQKSSQLSFDLCRTTTDRIEYDVSPATFPDISRRLEIHVIDGIKSNPNRVTLTDPHSNRLFQVGLISQELVDSSGTAYKVFVKTLAYAVATWALRISNTVENQIRPVRQTDIDSFKLLLGQAALLTDIYFAMENHPQMPQGAIPQDVFRLAIKKVAKNNSQQLK